MVIDDSFNSVKRVKPVKVNDLHEVKKNKKLPIHLTPFKQLLQKRFKAKNTGDQGVRLSGHAKKRLEERNLEFNTNEYLKIKDAIHKLKEKGGKDSLVITGQAAYIVDVDNETVVTAMDKNDMAENVFTKIDSTLFIN